MRFEEVKEALQPSVDDDLEALYGAYVQETGSEDVPGFIKLLVEGGIITQETFDEAIARAGSGGGDSPKWTKAELKELKVAQLKERLTKLTGTKPGKLKKGELISAILEAQGGAQARQDAKAAATAPGAPARSGGPPPVPGDLKRRTSVPAEPKEEFAEDPTTVISADKAGADEDEDEDVGDESTNVEAGDEVAAAKGDDGDDGADDDTGDGDDTGDSDGDGDGDREKTASGTYVLGDDGSNTNPEGENPRRRRREGSRTGARTGSRRKVRGTGETDTGARRRQQGERRDRMRKASANAMIAGKGYDFIGELGQGAMGAVLKAFDKDLNRIVAFKTMSAEIAATPLSSKFIGEAQITAQLEHPNIIPIYSLEATHEGNLAYSMKMVRGKTFEDVILGCHDIYDGKSKMDEFHSLTHRLEMFLNVCDAIHYAHQRGVVHRDLKPENIMVGPYNEVYVMDWGISKVFSSEASDDEQPVTLSSEPEEEGELIIGTPQYMSPEQAHGQNETLDGKSDQYALGLILYELISLKQAVTGKAPLKIVMRQQDGEKNPLSHYKGEKIPPELAAIALKGCAKEQKDRYESVQALGNDIRRYLRGEETKAKPDNILQRFFRFLQRHREATAFFIMSGFLMLGVVIILLMGWNAYSSRLAFARETRISQIQTSVAAQSALIDGTFVHYTGLLGVARATATDLLREGQTDEEDDDKQIHFAKGYDDGTFTELVDAERYPDMKISIDHPAYIIPGDVKNPKGAEFSLRTLLPMERHYRNIVLRSKDEKEQQAVSKRAERLIAEIGVPIAWVHVGLENGLYAGYPGHGGYPEQWDPRDRPWYELAKNKKVPTWGAPYPDYFNLGAILPCAAGLYDKSGAFMGVVAVEVTFDYIIEKLLEIDDLFTTKKKVEDRVEFFLVDSEGRVVVRSSKKDVKVRGGQLKPRPLRLVDLPYDEVRELIDKRSPGGKIESGDDLVFFYRLNALGWYYVVGGPSNVMLDKNAE